MRRPASARRNSRLSASSNERPLRKAAGDPGFVVCIDNEGCPASLERHKIYRVVPDAPARVHGLIRIVDESGEDYLYPREHFAPIELPAVIERALLRAS